MVWAVFELVFYGTLPAAPGKGRALSLLRSANSVLSNPTSYLVSYMFYLSYRWYLMFEKIFRDCENEVRSSSWHVISIKECLFELGMENRPDSYFIFYCDFFLKGEMFLRPAWRILAWPLHALPTCSMPGTTRQCIENCKTLFGFSMTHRSQG